MLYDQYIESGKFTFERPDNYLAHHGIKGQKWGVRRYQNSDGSLTEVGKKHYDRMSDDKLNKVLKKQVKQKKAELYGWGNQWSWRTSTGKYSDAVFKKSEEESKKYTSTKEYKDWNKKVNRLNSNADFMDPDEFDKKFEKLMSEQPKPSTRNIIVGGYEGSTDRGREFVNGYMKARGNYANEAGRTMSIARLKDLGYSDEAAKYFVDRLSRSSYVLD